MTSDAGWVIYGDESSYNYGAVRGVGAVSLRVDDSARLGAELASLLQASSVRELKWEKVRTARTAFAAQKALTWALDHALDGELEIETLTWEVTSAEASRARRPALTQLRNAYTTLLSSAMARHSERDDAIAGLANRPRRAVRHTLDAYTRGFATDRHHHARTLRAAATYPASRCLRGIGDLLARSLQRLRALALRSRWRAKTGMPRPPQKACTDRRRTASSCSTSSILHACAACPGSACRHVAASIPGALARQSSSASRPKR